MLDTEQLIIGARTIFEAERPEDIMSQHGLEFRAKVGRVYNSYDNSNRHYKHFIEYRLPRALSFSASLSKEGLIEKVTKLFMSEMQVGDSTFDDMVWIKATSEEACRAFLTDRCQGAVLNFVQQQGWVSIEGKSLQIAFISTNSELNSSDTLEHQVLGAYVTQWLQMS